MGLKDEAVLAKPEAWAPQEGPQMDGLECPVEDVCLGGARGGGKTVWLLFDFIQQATEFGKHAQGAIFRKRFTPDLQDVIRKGNLLLVEQLGWTYHGTEHRWTSPDGAILRAHYVETLDDAMQYKGHEFSWIGFDEIGDWSDPAAIDYLWACLRSAAGVPTVRRSTCNPGGPGHAWVKKRYDPEHPFIVRSWCPQPEEAPEIRIKSVFIPALLDDNPLLQKNDPGYEAKLAASGTKALYRAWRHGKWDIIAGQYFDIFDPRKHVVRIVPREFNMEPRDGEAVLAPWHKRWISMDWGFHDDTVVLWHAIDENRRVLTYRELVANHAEPVQIGELILANTPKEEQIDQFYLSHDAYASRTSPQTIASQIGTRVSQGGIPLPCVADQDRVGGWQLMYQMLVRGTWKIGDRCERLIESLPLLQRDEKKVNDVAEASVDHAPDAARYGLKTHLRGVTVPLDEQVLQVLNGPDGKGSTDPTIYMLQERVVRARLKKNGKRGFRCKPRRRYAA